jgi:hypothetical protein
LQEAKNKYKAVIIEDYKDGLEKKAEAQRFIEEKQQKNVQRLNKIHRYVQELEGFLNIKEQQDHTAKTISRFEESLRR